MARQQTIEMAELGYPKGNFKARHSWDYLRIEPVVLQYIEEQGYPDLIISSILETYVRKNTNMSGIANNRVPKVISQALHLVGYDCRSVRGKAFDKVLDSSGNPVVEWCIRAADSRHKTPPTRWKIVNTIIDAVFGPRDDHVIKHRKKPVREHVPDRIVPLTAFISI